MCGKATLAHCIAARDAIIALEFRSLTAPFHRCGSVGYPGGKLMAMINVQVWDATGNKRREVELPDDVAVNRILAVLVEKMNLPQVAPDGQPLSYKFHHRASGKQLLDDQSLSDVRAKDGDVLRLQPEITAG
jgi:hypothetical protein